MRHWPQVIVPVLIVLAGCERGQTGLSSSHGESAARGSSGVARPAARASSSATSPAVRVGAARDTLPFDESQVPRPKIAYGSFHVASDSARTIVMRSLGFWADQAVWTRGMIEFEYQDSIQVLRSENARPMWVLGPRASTPVPGWHMSLDVNNNGFEGEHKVLRGLRRAGWVEDAQYAADGPDGATVALCCEEAICYYSASWDGGDDSDPSDVPKPGMSIELAIVPRFPVRGPSR